MGGAAQAPVRAVPGAHVQREPQLLGPAVQLLLAGRSPAGPLPLQVSRCPALGAPHPRGQNRPAAGAPPPTTCVMRGPTPLDLLGYRLRATGYSHLLIRSTSLPSRQEKGRLAEKGGSQ